MKTVSLLLAAVAPTLVLSTPHGYVDAIKNATLLLTALESTFDYIVVGAGTAGLALASRLSEDPSKTTLVLEAGSLELDNAAILIPGEAGSALGTSIDWGFSTAPQEHAQGRSVYWPRGKVVGGSSAINFLALTRGDAREYDAWGALGNGDTWNWASLLPFFKKSENFTQPPSFNGSSEITFNSSVHGTTGPITASFPPFLANQFNAFYEALKAIGVPVTEDMSSGTNAGVSLVPSSIDPQSETRTTSVGYLTKAIGRSNLLVATNCQVTKINWSTAKNGCNVVATGVSFVATGSSQVLVANANSEVILSAGSLQSPQILELSGVGNSSVLDPVGVTTVVNLPGVGENLQDHPAVVNVYKLKPGVESLDSLIAGSSDLSSAVSAYGTGQGILTAALYPISYLSGSSLLSLEDQKTAINLSEQTGTGIPASQRITQTALYIAGAPVVELLGINVYFGASTAEANTTYISLASCLQHSLSRGSVHISSANATLAPSIDPQYLQNPFDKFILSKAAQYVRKVAATSPLADYIASEAEPGETVQTEAEWEDWVEGDVRTEYHPVGTTAMLPLADGGVVSPSFVVYGTENVRVVDLSIVPIHVSAHPQSLAYALGERAATLILSA